MDVMWWMGQPEDVVVVGTLLAEGAGRALAADQPLRFPACPPTWLLLSALFSFFFFAY